MFPSHDQEGGARTFTNSGTNIIVYKGLTQLDSVSGTPSSGEFKVTATGTNITPGSISVTGNPAVVADHSNMTADNATIGYDINVENSATFAKSQSFSTSQVPNSGSSAKAVSLTAPNFVIIYDAAGSNPSPSGNLTLTATSTNFYKLRYQHYCI